MQAPEIELKFAVPDLPSLLRGIEQAGFTLVTPRTLEQNTLYDTPERKLLDTGQLLRVRNYGPLAVVTHKRHPDEEQPDTPYKVRIETESEVADGAALAEIFTQLGYSPVFRYEKYRTEYEDPMQPGAHLVVDETPIGIWAELEGAPDWITRRLASLGVTSDACTTESYGRLFLAWRERTGSPAQNLTFDEITPGPHERHS